MTNLNCPKLLCSREDIIKAIIKTNTLKFGTRCECCGFCFRVKFPLSSMTVVFLEKSMDITRTQLDESNIDAIADIFAFNVVKTGKAGDHHLVEIWLQKAMPKPVLVTYERDLVIPLQNTKENAIVSVLTANGIKHEVLSADYLEFLQ